ncbi:MAG: transcription elongation factor GreA [Spirochaetes bacterium]|nr:transcription elongation factor GreA [Spirochaetota bacterium]
MMDIEKLSEKLKAELVKLKHEYDVELPAQIAEAREHGDLKENADYHAARERMGFVKGKIAHLNEQLERLHSIDLSNIPEDNIGFGSKVTLLDLDTDAESTITFVSEGEIDPLKGKITMATPYGRALAGKKPGEEVEVQIPAGTKKFLIKSLETIHGNEFSAKE